MTSQQLAKLDIPDHSGVYTFVDGKGRPLYIGRATSLRDRVKSYFSVDLIESRGPRIVDMVTKSKTVRWEQTDSVLEAIILESTLIKKYQPYYNIDDKDDKSSQYVIITDEVWPRVFSVRARDFDAVYKNKDKNVRSSLGYAVKKVFGPYPHGGLIKEALKILRKMFPFKDKKSFDSRHDMFYQALGRSPGEQDIQSHERYCKNIDRLILFFLGKKDSIRRSIEKEMNTYAKNLRFEQAQQCKRVLYAMDHINDIALIKRDTEKQVRIQGYSKNYFRIEAYDIAHLSGTDVVGAYVVYVNNEFVPSEYRKFNISKQKNDDIAGLMEILSRRFTHSEWTYPDIIVIDGNETQYSHAENILKARRISIPLVAVTKNDKHKASRLIGEPEIIKKHRMSIIAANAEAHRFVIKYHRQKRRSFFI